MRGAKSLVQDATKDNRSPPGGFVLKELADLSKASYPDCEEIVSLLFSRLKKNSPLIKHKVLKTIRYLALNGRADMARLFQKDSAAIRECSKYVGLHHALYGDDLNIQVRQSAEEAMKAVFAAPAASREDNTALRRKIQGYSGGQPSYGVNTPTHNSMGRMQGVGNTSYNPDRKSSTGMLDKFKGAVKAHFSTEPTSPTYGQRATYASPSTSMQARPVSSSQLQMQSAGQRRKKGQVGGVWASSSTSPVLTSPRVRQSSFASTTSSQRAEQVLQASATSHSKTGHESILVEELCTAGGVKAEPSKVALKQLHKGLPSLDLESLSEALHAKLDSEKHKWQVNKKALLVLEYLLAHDDGTVEAYFQENPDALCELASESRVQSVQKKAGQLLHKLNVDVAEVDVPSSGVVSPIAAETGGLLDLRGTAEQTQSVSGFSFIADTAPETSGDPSSLFDGLQIGTAPSHAQSTIDDTLFSFTAPSDPPASSPVSDDVFADIAPRAESLDTAMPFGFVHQGQPPAVSHYTRPPRPAARASSQHDEFSFVSEMMKPH